MSEFVHTVRGKLYDDERGVRRFKPNDEKAFRWLFLRGEPGEEWEVGARKVRKKHSAAARGYLHGVVIPEILRAMEYENSKENSQAIYKHLQRKYGPVTVFVGKNDEEIVMPKSGSDYTTAEMAQLIDGAIRWAGETLEITIPPPNRVMSFDGGGI